VGKIKYLKNFLWIIFSFSISIFNYINLFIFSSYFFSQLVVVLEKKTFVLCNGKGIGRCAGEIKVYCVYMVVDYGLFNKSYLQPPKSQWTCKNQLDQIDRIVFLTLVQMGF